MSFLENKGTAAHAAVKAGGTFSQQGSVPQLPVPELSATCEKFLHWVRPLVDEATFATTSQRVSEFKNGPGKVLHAALLQRAKQRDQPSWLHAWWQDSYLATRCPNAVNINYGLLLNDLPQFHQDAGSIGVAAALTIAAAEFKGVLDRQEYAPLKERGKPLCMAQFKKTFATCRLPMLEKDLLQSSYPSPSRHVAVLYHGNVAVLDVISPEGRPYSYASICASLGEIVNALTNPTPSTNLCAVTGGNRDHWAKTRFNLLQTSTANIQKLALVEGAMFAIALDDTTYPNLTEQTRAALHGNGCNRWFDLCFNLWVSQDGHAGLNGEHSWGDGHTTMSLLDWMMEWLAANPPAALKQHPTSKPFWAPVEFDVTAAVRDGISEAIREIRDLIEDTSMQVVEFTKFGADGIKKLKVSPDAFLQAAMNAAQLPAFGKISSCYESAMTKAFNCGRTEAMRPVTPELVTFAHTLFSPSASNQEKLAKLQAAAEAHRVRILECKDGMGVERHLYGMQMIFSEQGSELGVTSAPALFSDPAFKLMKHDTLSTSSLPSPNLKSFCFGPVVDDGLGLGYQVVADRIVITCSAKRSNIPRQAVFCKEVVNVLQQMADLLSARQSKL